jgi:hypothetical protein
MPGLLLTDKLEAKVVPEVKALVVFDWEKTDFYDKQVCTFFF